MGLIPDFLKQTAAATVETNAEPQQALLTQRCEHKPRFKACTNIKEESTLEYNHM